MEGSRTVLLFVTGLAGWSEALSCVKLQLEVSVPTFRILSRVDAYVDYTCEVEADSAEEAVDLVYEGHVKVAWENHGVTEFDAVRMSAIDEDWNDIDGYTRGKG
jgi:hypothetical protein